MIVPGAPSINQAISPQVVKSTRVRRFDSRDGKRGRPIVVYGVMADRAGRPGNTGDPATVPDQVNRLRRQFGLKPVVLVGDRGLLTETQITHLKRYPGLG